MPNQLRKNSQRTAPGWRFSRSLHAWICDKHGSTTCSVCPRPTLEPGDERPWLIDTDGIAMPQPTPADLVPGPSRVSSSHEGAMRSVEIIVDMRSRELADLSSEVSSFSAPLGDGLLNVLVPHATAGLALIELGHGTEDDVIDHLERLAPQDAAYGNMCGLGDEGSDHLMPVMLTPALTLPVIDGRPMLSGSQSIVLIDRFYGIERRVRLSFVAA